MNSSKRNPRAFSLLEMLFSIIILIGGIVGIMALLPMAMALQEKAEVRYNAEIVAMNSWHTVKGRGFSINALRARDHGGDGKNNLSRESQPTETSTKDVYLRVVIPLDTSDPVGGGYVEFFNPKLEIDPTAEGETVGYPWQVGGLSNGQSFRLNMRVYATDGVTVTTLNVPKTVNGGGRRYYENRAGDVVWRHSNGLIPFSDFEIIDGKTHLKLATIQWGNSRKADNGFHTFDIGSGASKSGSSTDRIFDESHSDFQDTHIRWHEGDANFTPSYLWTISDRSYPSTLPLEERTYFWLPFIRDANVVAGSAEWVAYTMIVRRHKSQYYIDDHEGQWGEGPWMNKYDPIIVPRISASTSDSNLIFDVGGWDMEKTASYNGYWYNPRNDNRGKIDNKGNQLDVVSSKENKVIGFKPGDKIFFSRENGFNRSSNSLQHAGFRGNSFNWMIAGGTPTIRSAGNSLYPLPLRDMDGQTKLVKTWMYQPMKANNSRNEGANTITVPRITVVGGEIMFP